MQAKSTRLASTQRAANRLQRVMLCATHKQHSPLTVDMLGTEVGRDRNLVLWRGYGTNTVTAGIRERMSAELVAKY